jgi:CrcB protein
MKQLLVVGLGGFMGSIARYKLGGILLHHSASWRFPLSTFIINVGGCFIIGALAALAEHRDAFSPDVRLFLFTGILGGFTTFSAFGYEAFYLLRRGEVGVLIAYASLSVVVGLAAVALGFKLLSLVAR